jgi:hypothetical protein
MGPSSLSSYATATTQSAPISAPTAPTISDITLTQNELGIRIAWNTVSGASSYRIYRSNAKYGTYSLIASNISSNIFDDTAVNLNTVGNAYFYQVEAVNSAGPSPKSTGKGITLTAPRIYAYNPASSNGVEYYGCRLTISGTTYTVKCPYKFGNYPNGYSTSTSKVELTVGTYSYSCAPLRLHNYGSSSQGSVTLKPGFLYKVNTVHGNVTKTLAVVVE